MMMRRIFCPRMAGLPSAALLQAGRQQSPLGITASSATRFHAPRTAIAALLKSLREFRRQPAAVPRINRCEFPVGTGTMARDLRRIEAMAETKPVAGARMLASAVTLIVRVCARVPWLIIVLVLAAAAASAVYSARHFAINTDINKLISPDLDWRQRELEFEKLFPGHFGSTLVVVDAPTAELAAQASADLTRRLDGAAGAVHLGRGHGRQRVFLAQRLVVSPGRRRRATDARPAPGRAADRHAGRRSEPARPDAGDVARFSSACKIT